MRRRPALRQTPSARRMQSLLGRADDGACALGLIGRDGRLHQRLDCVTIPFVYQFTRRTGHQPVSYHKRSRTPETHDTKKERRCRRSREDDVTPGNQFQM